MSGPRVWLKLFVVAACIVAIVATPATGSAAIKIARIRYNPPGIDSGTNLNHEFVVIRNTGQRREILTDWTLVERREDLVFSFPRFRIGAGDKVTIHTGVGTDRRFHLFWGRSTYVWNNGRDKAILRSDSGDRVDRCSYVVDPEVVQWLGHSADC